MRRTTVLAVATAALFLALFAIDAVRAPEPFDAFNFAVDLAEVVLLAVAIALSVVAATEAREMKKERRALIDDLAAARQDGERWRDAARAHVTGLSRAIATQFIDWHLTESEADVAGLMLKGLAHKEIATLRNCSEATVRQHATAVYSKSHMGNRAQLTAYFLEDLLMPNVQPTPNAKRLSVVAKSQE